MIATGRVIDTVEFKTPKAGFWASRVLAVLKHEEIQNEKGEKFQKVWVCAEGITNPKHEVMLVCSGKEFRLVLKSGIRSRKIERCFTAFYWRDQFWARAKQNGQAMVAPIFKGGSSQPLKRRMVIYPLEYRGPALETIKFELEP